jgi:hypothetical protein
MRRNRTLEGEKIWILCSSVATVRAKGERKKKKKNRSHDRKVTSGCHMLCVSVWLCVCVCELSVCERERERECVCASVFLYFYLCVYACMILKMLSLLFYLHTCTGCCAQAGRDVYIRTDQSIGSKIIFFVLAAIS